MRFNTLGLIQLTTAICLGSQVAVAELIVNGSFEVPSNTLPRGWTTYSSIPGWTGGTAGIEIQADGVGNFTARGIARGEQFAELDTSSNSSMFQDVPTIAGAVYELMFAYAPRQTRASRPINSNDIEVFWEENLVASLGGPSSPESFRQEEWVTRTFQVAASSTSGRSRLQFIARGASDSVGGLIDRVSLIQVPEPSSLALAVLTLGVFARARCSGPANDTHRRRCC